MRPLRLNEGADRVPPRAPVKAACIPAKKRSINHRITTNGLAQTRVARRLEERSTRAPSGKSSCIASTCDSLLLPSNIAAKSGWAPSLLGVVVSPGRCRMSISPRLATSTLDSGCAAILLLRRGILADESKTFNGSSGVAAFLRTLDANLLRRLLSEPDAPPARSSLPVLPVLRAP